MPTMRQRFPLLKDPKIDAEATGQFADDAANVEVVGNADSFLKIKVLDFADEPEGWVAAQAVNLSGTPPAGPIDKTQFALSCWTEALLSDANAHYMVAVAELRSKIATGEENGRIGPFRLSQAEWDAGRANAAFALGSYRASDIADWRKQCVMFALMAHAALEALKTALGRQPTAAELYLAQLITPAVAAPAIKDPTTQITVPHPGLANPVKAGDALAKLVTDLDGALTTVKDAVVTAGTQLLGDDADVDATTGQANKPVPGGGSAPTGGTNTTGIAGAGGPLGTMVAKFESNGNYNAFNRGTAGVSPGPPIDFSQMTLTQVMAQQTRTAANPRPLFAVGKYQLIPSTMKAAISALKLNPDTKMTNAIQESFFRNYLIAAKRPKIKSFITGAGASLADAQFALALEFASMPDPTRGGRSHYGGIAGNKALVDLQTVASKLNAEKALFQQKVAGGMSAADAWNALST